MRKLVVIFLLLTFSLNAQVFNTAQTLKRGTINIGLNPDVLNDDFGFFLHGGYGLSPGFDIGTKIGLGLPDTYFGVDFEWVLRGTTPYISIAAGAHSFNDVGLDGTLNFTFPVNQLVQLYTGVDMDLNFTDSRNDKGEKTTEMLLPFWMFVGAEIGLRKNMTMMLEIEIALSDDAYHIFGGGINFYL